MNRQILQLAIPSIISNITVPLLGLVDVAITGHMGDTRYMAAIAVASMIFNLMYWLFSFLRFGTGGLTAQAYGRKDTQECGALLMRSHATCLLIAITMLILQVPILRLALMAIGPEADLIEPITHYYNICIWGTLPSLALYAFNGWFVGMQNTRFPMIISISQNLVNIGMSYMLVYWMGMKIEGVALGTLIAQWFGVILAMVIASRKYSDVLHDIDLREALHIEQMKQFFKVNRILFYRTLFLIAVNLHFIKAGAKGGAVILSVNSVLMQMFILYSYISDGFAFAAEALCGKYYGANDRHNFLHALRLIWYWGIGLMVIYTAAYTLFGNDFVAMLTDDDSVRLAAHEFLPWAIAIPICGLGAFIWDGIFVGMTETKGMLVGTMSGAITFFVLYQLLDPSLGNHALWLGFNAYLLMRGIAQSVIYVKKRF